jgi:hypothetical protein
MTCGSAIRLGERRWSGQKSHIRENPSYFNAKPHFYLTAICNFEFDCTCTDADAAQWSGVLQQEEEEEEEGRRRRNQSLFSSLEPKYSIVKFQKPVLCAFAQSVTLVFTSL